MDDLAGLIEEFIRKLKISDSLDSLKGEGVIEVYNEFSVQFELAIFLRKELNPRYKILLERNIKDFESGGKRIKSEIDLVVYNPDNKDKTAIEIKVPRGVLEGKEQAQGKTPLRMYECIEDLKFLEELKDYGFTNAFFVLFTDNKLFWKETGREKNRIYDYFRRRIAIEGKIKKPFEPEEEPIVVRGPYIVNWERAPLDKEDKSKYWIQQVN